MKRSYASAMFAVAGMAMAASSNFDDAVPASTPRPGERNRPTPPAEPKVHGDGYDDDRLARAAQKRARKAAALMERASR